MHLSNWKYSYLKHVTISPAKKETWYTVSRYGARVYVLYPLTFRRTITCYMKE